MSATRVGDVDGHGLFGVLDETAEGLLCHDCGWRGQHLGLHVYRAHGLTASGYRFAHGLKGTRGLVGAATRAVITANATRRYTKPAGAAFRRARDPQAAALARLTQALPPSPEAAAARDAVVARIGRSTRVPRVVKCGWCRVSSALLEVRSGDDSAPEAVQADRHARPQLEPVPTDFILNRRDHRVDPQLSGRVPEVGG